MFGRCADPDEPVRAAALEHLPILTIPAHSTRSPRRSASDPPRPRGRRTGARRAHAAAALETLLDRRSRTPKPGSAISPRSASDGWRPVGTRRAGEVARPDPAPPGGGRRRRSGRCDRRRRGGLVFSAARCARHGELGHAAVRVLGTRDGGRASSRHCDGAPRAERPAPRRRSRRSLRATLGESRRSAAMDRGRRPPMSTTRAAACAGRDANRVQDNGSNGASGGSSALVACAAEPGRRAERWTRSPAWRRRRYPGWPRPSTPTTRRFVAASSKRSDGSRIRRRRRICSVRCPMRTPSSGATPSARCRGLARSACPPALDARAIRPLSRGTAGGRGRAQSRRRRAGGACMRFAPENLGLQAAGLPLLRDLVHERTGLFYDNGRFDTLADRLSPLVIERGFRSFLDFYYLLKYDEREAPAEWRASSTRSRCRKRTSGGRSIRFAGWRADCCPRSSSALRTEPMRIWSVPCATGEEPLTIAMVLEEAGMVRPCADRDSCAATPALRRSPRRAPARYRERSFRALPPRVAREVLLRR